MSPTLQLRAEAVADVLEAFSWYQAQRSGLGWEFQDSLNAAFDHLRQNPEAGPAVYRDVRRVLLRRFPYAVYYTLGADLLEIRAVVHLRRHPRRWRKRGT